MTKIDKQSIFFGAYCLCILKRVSINHVGSWGGGGVRQITTLLYIYKFYLVKVSTNEGGGQIYTKYCPRGLWMVPSSDGLEETAYYILAVERIFLGH